MVFSLVLSTCGAYLHPVVFTQWCSAWCCSLMVFTSSHSEQREIIDRGGGGVEGLVDCQDRLIFALQTTMTRHSYRFPDKSFAKIRPDIAFSLVKKLCRGGV